MKVAEAVKYMTKSYLHRVIDSFTRDFPKVDEERSRAIIVKNVSELTNHERISRVLSFVGCTYAQRVLYQHILTALVSEPDHVAAEDYITSEVVKSEKSILKKAKDPNSLKYEDPHDLDVYQAVLEVAIDDQQITDPELNILRRLRKKLRLTETTNKILLARLRHYPRSGNKPHTPAELRDSLMDLTRTGVLFYCNRLMGGVYVIPDEVVAGVRAALAIELADKPWSLLLNHLSNQQLSAVLNAKGLPKYGRKEEKVERVKAASVSPSDALSVLSNGELYELCKSLPGVNVSGSKQEKIDRVVDYFANLVVKEVAEEAEPAEKYYEYLVELAKRDRENLLTNKVIKKDKDMDAAFEKGTRFLFRQKLGLELLPMAGSDHPDGKLEFRAGGDLLLWDTKSKEGIYSFPESHLKQFKRYIRDSDRRTSCFLIIVPHIGDGTDYKAARLKVESKTDTDVALITAEDLKWVAEEWSRHKRQGTFNLEVFNITGILDRSTLEARLKLFA